MVWLIKFSDNIEKDLRRIDTPEQKRIKKFLHERIAPLDNPRSIGEPLSGILRDYWKYRVGDYRLICDIQDNIITILVLAIGNRKQVYRR